MTPSSSGKKGPKGHESFRQKSTEHVSRSKTLLKSPRACSSKRGYVCPWLATESERFSPTDGFDGVAKVAPSDYYAHESWTSISTLSAIESRRPSGAIRWAHSGRALDVAARLLLVGPLARLAACVLLGSVSGTRDCLFARALAGQSRLGIGSRLVGVVAAAARRGSQPWDCRVIGKVLVTSIPTRATPRWRVLCGFCELSCRPERYLCVAGGRTAGSLPNSSSGTPLLCRKIALRYVKVNYGAASGEESRLSQSHGSGGHNDARGSDDDADGQARNAQGTYQSWPRGAARKEGRIGGRPSKLRPNSNRKS